MIKINYTSVVSVQFYYLDSFCYSFLLFIRSSRLILFSLPVVFL